ncbi:PIN domain-containing protein [Streptomyces sp. HUAS TT7]|uniref:PIN domain-containing protein n=1 Tax=Streptomyces sp. HUAS TT7 TaxID=3447507 RepID=UPI003F660A49
MLARLKSQEVRCRPLGCFGNTLVEETCVIVFDSNALFGLSPDAPKFDLLRALKRSGRHRVAIPWMVQEELVAQKVIRQAEAHQEAVSAVRALNRVTPWRLEAEPRAFDPEEARRYWRQKYGELFEIIETSGDVARQALSREAHCEKPAKGADAKAKGGARDAAIWLSVIDYLTKNPGETVHFISANTRDFGDGNSFPSPMGEDVEGLGDRLVLMTSFDAVVAEFTTPLEIDEKHIEDVLVGLLTREETLSPLESAVKDLLIAKTCSWVGTEANGFLAGLGSTDVYAPIRWNAWVGTPKAFLRRVHEVSGHRIGEEEWYTATVDWILVGYATRPTTVSPSIPAASLSENTGRIACQLRSKLLFSSKPGETPTFLQFWPPTALDPAEVAEWEPRVLEGMSTPGAATAALGVLLAFMAASFLKSKNKGEESTTG